MTGRLRVLTKPVCVSCCLVDATVLVVVGGVAFDVCQQCAQVAPERGAA